MGGFRVVKKRAKKKSYPAGQEDPDPGMDNSTEAQEPDVQIEQAPATEEPTEEEIEAIMPAPDEDNESRREQTKKMVKPMVHNTHKQLTQLVCWAAKRKNPITETDIMSLDDSAILMMEHYGWLDDPNKIPPGVWYGIGWATLIPKIMMADKLPDKPEEPKQPEQPPEPPKESEKIE